MYFNTLVDKWLEVLLQTLYRLVKWGAALMQWPSAVTSSVFFPNLVPLSAELACGFLPTAALHVRLFASYIFVIELRIVRQVSLNCRAG